MESLWMDPGFIHRSIHPSKFTLTHILVQRLNYCRHSLPSNQRGRWPCDVSHFGRGKPKSQLTMNNLRPDFLSEVTALFLLCKGRMWVHSTLTPKTDRSWYIDLTWGNRLGCFELQHASRAIGRISMPADDAKLDCNYSHSSWTCRQTEWKFLHKKSEGQKMSKDSWQNLGAQGISEAETCKTKTQKLRNARAMFVVGYFWADAQYGWPCPWWNLILMVDKLIQEMPKFVVFNGSWSLPVWELSFTSSPRGHELVATK